MRRTVVPFLLAAAAATAGCEDGPEQIFAPNAGDPEVQNGRAPSAPYVQPGEQGFGSTAGVNDNAGRARFCSERENEDLVQSMVVAPIVPDVGMGLVNFRNADDSPTHADDLIGRPEDGKLCDPDLYSNALTWGPTNEIIVFINTETRLVESLAATAQYLGFMENLTYEAENAEGEMEMVAISIKNRERIFLGDQELDQYTSRADQANKPNAWANNGNINKMYRAIRATFFDQTIDPSYDCLATKLCSTFYDSDTNQGSPQGISLYFQDSGVYVPLSEDGYVLNTQILPVRSAPFENNTSFDFGEDADEPDVAGNVAPTLHSISQPGCDLDMSQEITWGEFKSMCIDANDTRTLDRVSYNVFTQRDAVDVEFNGTTLTFQRTVSEEGTFQDGERPKDSDVMVGMTITRTLNAPVAEFVPKDLAWDYRIKLVERLHAAVNAPPVPEPEDGEDPLPLHPFLTYSPDVPDSLSEDPQPIEQLFWDGPNGQENWNNTVITEIRELYNSLTPEQRAQVDPIVIEPTWIIEPFVDVVLDTFSHGNATGPTVYKAFRNTDSRRWVIGYAHFIQDGVPYRFVAQYSLNYGAITAVTIGRGYSEIDGVFNLWNEELREPLGFGQPKYPYFGLDLAKMDPATNPFALGGDGIRVLASERQYNTMTVKVTSLTDRGNRELIDLTVPGDPIEDRNGFLKQIRGERYEWVPANIVRLFGRENGMIFYVGADGRIERVGEGGFKRPVTLCPGLDISYGDDVRKKVQAFTEANGVDAYRECEVVYNYSDNGNVLDAVLSLTHRVSFVTVNGRAVQADVWR